MLTTFFAIIFYVAVVLLLTGMILFVRKKCIGSAKYKVQINEWDPIDVPRGQTLLDTLTDKDIAVPSPCGGKATCRQCKVRTEGGGVPLSTEETAFSYKQLQEGWRLSCQCKVKEDLRVFIPESLLEVKEFVGKVISNDNVSTFIKELVVEIPDEMNYKSGGFAQINIPQYKTNTDLWKETIDNKYYCDWEKFGMFGCIIDYKPTEDIARAYSMASYPAEGRKLIFNVRIASPPLVKGQISKKIPWGIGSSYLFSLKTVDEITLTGAYGESFMIDDDRELVFLIGGAGSSFARSHILDLFKTKKTKRKVSLWYGARSLKENIYQKEFEGLDKQFNNFSYHLALSEPDEDDIKSGWPMSDSAKTNFLFKAFEEGQLKQMESPEDNLYYVCGPPLHNSSVVKLLISYGVDIESILVDSFES